MINKFESFGYFIKVFNANLTSFVFLSTPIIHKLQINADQNKVIMISTSARGVK